MMAGEQCYAAVGERRGVEHLRSLAGSVGEIGISDQVTRSRQFDQHPIASRAGAMNLDHSGQHRENNVGR